MKLTRALQNLYYHWVVSTDGCFEVRVGPTTCRFWAKDPYDLRGLEGDFVSEQDFVDALANTLRQGDVFFDIGSSVGQFAIPMAKIVGPTGRVMAFEPEAVASERLQRHIAINGLTNVSLFRMALGEENCKAKLLFGDNICPSLLPHQGECVAQNFSQAVEVVRGDRLVLSQALPIPRAVKIDVEGYEYSVLRGLKRTLAHRACELLCLEIHPTFLPAGVTQEQIAEFVESLGFSREAESLCRGRQVHMIAKRRAN